MATTQQTALADALSNIDKAFGVGREITAPKAHAAHLAREAERLTYAEARADLDARARAGKTVQGRNNKGHFLRGVKVFTAGVAPVAQAPAKVEKVATVAKVAVRVDRERSAPASAVVVSAGV